MSNWKSLCVAAILSVGTAAPTFAQVAADASATSEFVVKRGGEYYAANASSVLIDNDCVTAIEKSAILKHANGCEFELDAAQSVIINGDAVSCDTSFTAANGVCAISDFESQDLQFGLIPLLIGAVAVTTIIVAQDSPDPVSP